MAYVKRIHIL